LSIHKEYKLDVLAELQGLPMGYSVKDLESLPLLDSFVKESARLNSFEAVTGRRKALVPFIFSDGRIISPGDWVGIPQRAMMLDPDNYTNPSEFDGFRSLKIPSEKVRYTDASPKWHYWGCGRLLCPGRFYASMLVKTIIMEFVLSYDFQLRDENQKYVMNWRSASVPKTSTIMLMRRKTLV